MSVCFGASGDGASFSLSSRANRKLSIGPFVLAANFCGIFTGWATDRSFEPISLGLFLENGFKDVMFSDLIAPTLKTAVFGFIIGTVACFQGMRTEGGTEGVGRSATSAVVLSSLFVILADVLLVRLTQMLAA